MKHSEGHKARIKPAVEALLKERSSTLRYEAMAGFSEETRAVRFLPGPGPGLVRDPQEAQPMRWQTVAG